MRSSLISWFHIIGYFSWVIKSNAEATFIFSLIMYEQSISLKESLWYHPRKIFWFLIFVTKALLSIAFLVSQFIQLFDSIKELYSFSKINSKILTPNFPFHTYPATNLTIFLAPPLHSTSQIIPYPILCS